MSSTLVNGLTPFHHLILILHTRKKFGILDLTISQSQYNTCDFDEYNKKWKNSIVHPLATFFILCFLFQIHHLTFTLSNKVRASIFLTLLFLTSSSPFFRSIFILLFIPFTFLHCFLGFNCHLHLQKCQLFPLLASSTSNSLCHQYLFNHSTIFIKWVIESLQLSVKRFPPHATFSLFSFVQFLWISFSFMYQ